MVDVFPVFLKYVGFSSNLLFYFYVLMLLRTESYFYAIRNPTAHMMINGT